MTDSDSNPAPETNPAPEAPPSPEANPAPVPEANPVPENEPLSETIPIPDALGCAIPGSNPAPEAPTKPREPNADGSEEGQVFDDKHPDERFNTITQGDVAELMELSAQLTKITLGVGWDLVGFDEKTADLDVSLFLLNKELLTREDSDFVFYSNEEALEGGIKHTGDSRTGAGSGDDEQILIDLNTIPFDITSVMVVLSIYDPESRGYTFKNVRNVYMRVEDRDTERELFRYFLDDELTKKPESGGDSNGLYIGHFLRDANSWKFEALGQVDDGGLGKIATKYGIVIVGG
jgi:tellurium resistance protein TerD